MGYDQSLPLLVVDDEDYIRHMVARILEAKGYTCLQAEGGVAALKTLEAHPAALIITDLMMPDLSGLEVLAQARRIQPDVAVIILTGVDSHDTAVQALELGAYGYVIKPFQPNELLINVVNALRRRDLERLRDDYEHHLEREVEQRTHALRHREQEITLRLVTASEYRDEETGTHIRRMAEYATLLACAIGWTSDNIELLRLAAPMHDIGKIGIPDHILLKPGQLSADEFTQIQRHTLIGANILDGSNIPLLQMAKDVALCHHERWDGSGYPHQLAGDAIPECARIVTIADVYDALHTDRIYRPAFSDEDAWTMLMKMHTHFEPRLFSCLVEHREEFRQLRQELRDLPSSIPRLNESVTTTDAVPVKA